MLEHTILARVLFDDKYTRKVLPYLNVEYFQDKNDQVIMSHVRDYFNKHNVAPSKTALLIEIDNSRVLNDDNYKKVVELVQDFDFDVATNMEWLIDETEKFCKDKALRNAISKAISIYEGKDDKEGPGVIPKLVEDALSISFDTNIGHDYFMNLQERYEFYHRIEEKIAFDIDLLNEVTKGGISRKTLTILMAGTGGGKSLAMCHMAASNIRMGYNVLYITMEMAEERIAERIDANLLDTPIDELATMPFDTFNNRLNKLKDKSAGQLIIKEYPTSTAGAGHFRYLLSELKQKKNFVPDIIYIDYLNICCSSRVKMSHASMNSYTYIKNIAEELRGLAVEYNCPIVSATQVNRAGFTDSDFGLENTSESFGLPATCDLMFGLISTDEIAALGQILFKQLKNRYADLTKKMRFVVGIDKSRMKLYNVENHAQDDIIDTPVMNNTPFGEREEEDKKKFSKEKFKGFK